MPLYSIIEGAGDGSTTENGIPNVSQYGWSSYEVSEYKQLIEYVDEARKYAESIKGVAEFVLAVQQAIIQLKAEVDAMAEDLRLDYAEAQGLYAEIKAFHTQIVEIDTRVTALAQQVAIDTADVKKILAQVTSLRNEVLTLKASVDISERKAASSATAAQVAEAGAEDYFNKSYDLYLDLKKGQVYRGPWNPNSGAYPTNKTTNSVWDVVLNPDQQEHTFDGKRWFWGDRLVYVKDENKFYQIEAGTSVKSVNGKAGAVVLTAEDVKALPLTGGTITGDLIATRNVKSTLNHTGSYFTIAPFSTNYGRDYKCEIYFKEHDLNSTDPNYGLVINAVDRSSSPNVNKDLNIWLNGKRVYHQGVKPTAAEIGAVSKTGDTMSGVLAVSNRAQFGTGADGKSFGSPNISDQMDDKIEIVTPSKASNNPSTGIVFHNRNASSSALYFRNESASNGYFNFVSDEVNWDVRVNGNPVYHTGNKPTAAEFFGVGGKQGAAADGVSYTEDGSKDFNKLLTAGEYSISGDWANGVNNAEVAQNHACICKVEVRNWAAQCAYKQTVTIISEDSTNQIIRSGTGAYPNITWTRWMRFGPYEANIQYRAIIDRPGNSSYPYMTLVKPDDRTDLTSGWYTIGAVQFKHKTKSDPNNPDSAVAAGIFAVDTMFDRSQNRIKLQTRNSGGGATSEMVLYEGYTDFNKGATRYARFQDGAASVNGTLSVGSKIYHNAMSSSNKQVVNANTSNHVFFGNPTVTALKLEIASDGMAVVNQGGTDRRIYHEGYKPTSEDLGFGEESPLPDVWIPFNDSLRMITGFGDYDRVYIGDQYLELNSRSASFERATTATYTDKSGVLRTADINEPRFEKEGLLIEGQSTNLFRGDALRPPSGVVTSNISSSKYPNIVATKAVGTKTVPIIIGASRESIENSTVYSASVIIDLANSNITTGLLRYRFAYAANWQSRYIDVYTDGRVHKLSEGTTGSAKVVGGLLFISMTTTSSDTASTSGGGSVDIVSLLKDGVEPSGAPDDYSVCVVGFQLEKLPLSTSYIPTKGAAVTRAVDKCWIQSVSNFPFQKGLTASCAVTASWVGSVAPNPAPRVFSVLSDASSAVESSIYEDGRFNSYGVGGGSFVPFSNGDIVSTIVSDVISSQVGNVKVDGGTTYPWGGVRGEIYIGSQTGGNGRALFGHIRNLRIWHRALSSTQIKSLR